MIVKLILKLGKISWKTFDEMENLRQFIKLRTDELEILAT